MDQIKVLIVDDHSVTREGLKAILETDPRILVVGEAADGQNAVELVMRLSPNVVLMDIRMPGIGGVEATRLIKKECPNTAVIMVSSFEEEALVMDSLVAGATGYLLKDSSKPLLLNAIGAVANGGILIRASLFGPMMNHFPHSNLTIQGLKLDRLTPREREVLRLLAEGETNKEIGDSLGLAEVTVKKIVQTVIGKLHASGRTNAAITGMRYGLIT